MAFDPEKFIKIVENHPILYDPNHENHKNNFAKNRVWDNIAALMNEPGGRDVVKTKWKNFRDTYFKHLRAVSLDREDTPKYIEQYRTWPWASYMKFLKPVLESSPRRKTKQQQQQAKVEEKEPPFSPTSSNEGSSYQESQVHFFDPAQKEPTKTHSKISDLALDEIDLIFIGYARTIKKMCVRRQALVKFEIAKLIMNAELNANNIEYTIQVTPMKAE